MRVFLVVLIGLLASLSVAAAERCDSWGCISTISNLYVTSDGVIYVGTPLDEKLANCTPVAGVYFTLDPSSANAKEIYSSMLSAYMSKKKIQLRIKEGDSRCELAYVVLSTTF